MVLRDGKAPGFFLGVGVLFILAGLYFVAGRFLTDAWLRRDTRYAVTNRRILVARSGAFGRLTSVSLDRLPDMQLSERADGSGTIRFGQPYPSAAWGSFGAMVPTLDPVPQFIAIDNAQSTFDLIQRASRAVA